MNPFFKDQENNESIINIAEPEKITNIAELADSCEIVLVLKFDKNENTPRHYYRCTRPNGEQYNIE
ncbi:hypothetical protein PT276_00700 [Orbaceae bacterium ESL0721]|nr:hypothetical protein [Orbaceae bacterium ESL0721]